MEPVQIGRDDMPPRRRPQPHERAAMEPVQIGRDDSRVHDGRRAGRSPQWSPSRSDGMTMNAPYYQPAHQPAAMEPVQIGRDDVGRIAGDVAGVDAAMEPVQIGRDDDHSLLGAMYKHGPQWSPSRSDGMTDLLHQAHAVTSRRNGARPDRTG